MRVSLKLDPPILGIVRDQSGKPVPGATVVATPSGERFATTDARGQFRIDWKKMAEKTYLYVYHASRNLAGKVRLKENAGPVDIVVKAAITLSGRVTGRNGAPVPVAQVELRAKIANWYTTPAPAVVTDSRGRYEIPAVPAADDDFKYTVGVIAPGYAPLKNEPIPIKQASSKRLDIAPLVLKPLDTSVSGFVVDAAGKRVPGKIVHLAGPNGRDGQLSKSILTDAKGLFRFDRIAKGPLRLSAGWASSRNTGSVFAEAGAENVQITLGREKVYWHPTTLVGMPLPPISKLGLDRFWRGSSFSRTLICFWDMNDPKSQEYVGKLGGDAPVLAKRRTPIRVALIHVGGSPGDRHQAWLNRQRITLPCGSLRGGRDELKSTWAANSLPWLVLTDRKSIVSAEGFAPNELNGLLKKMPSDNPNVTTCSSGSDYSQAFSRKQVGR